MRAVLRLLLAVVVRAFAPLGRRLVAMVGRTPPAESPTRIAESPGEDRTLERQTGGPAWAELTVAGLLVVAAVCFLGFLVLVVAHPQTQLLGGLLGGGLAAVAGALILAGLLIVPQEQAEEPRSVVPEPDQQRGLVEDLREGVEGVSRRRLLAGAAGTAGAALGAAAITVPLTAIGPGTHVLSGSPWRAGVHLVDDEGEPITLDQLQIGSFLTAFAAGADKRELGSPLVVVRVDPATLRLPAGRRGWAPEGVMAYSKICTHAGCPVSLFRHPRYEPTSPSPALVCPCHYSTFDIRRGAKVIEGPAGRPLPQLPLRLDGDRRLVATGGLSGSVGPAWWGTRRS